MSMIWLMIAAASAANCADVADYNAMLTCQKNEADLADGEMNRVWKALRTKMQALDRETAQDAKPGEPGHGEALLASQRTWLAFRDAQCRIASYEWRGGSMQQFSENRCMAQVTRARTAQLREMLGWSGDR